MNFALYENLSPRSCRRPLCPLRRRAFRKGDPLSVAACAAVLRRRPDGHRRASDVAAPVGDGRRSDDRDFGTPHRGPRAADHRTLQNLFGIPRRAVRQVLFLGRHAPDGFRHHRQIPDRRRDAVPQHLGDQGDRGRHFVPHSRAAANPAFLVDARRRNRPLGGEAPLPGDLEDPGAGLRPLPRTALRAGHRLQRHGPAGRRRPHPRRGVCLSRGAAICRGGIQRPVGVRETAIPLPLDGCRDRFLLGLRLLL